METEEAQLTADSDTQNGQNEIEARMEVPNIGMYFGSYEDLLLFYKVYGKETGFGICKRSSRNDDNGEMKYVTLTCAREGKSRRTTMSSVNSRPISKSDCKARITASRDSDGRWKITSIVLDHNHEMSPSKSRFFPCNRVLAPNVKRRLELNDQSGIGVSDTYNALVVEAGGHENLPFQEIDCRNYVNQVRHLRLGKGDATAVHNYFLKMQADNPEFFHLIDFDDENRIRNLFWADARCRAACKEFGDVITFDTTYLTNKYDMPFAPFVGVNHHGQSVLLGCGLISKENIETFMWLFRAWLTCMNDCPPNAIITDQDKAMKAAVAIVFPNAKHRWCLWHILKKLPEKFGAHKKYESIKYRMHQAIYDSLTPTEFEENWGKFIEKYELGKNTWLAELYEERYRWVPGYVKDVFWAGMSTTQRSESMNSLFDGYVDSKTTLKQFVEQYGNALRGMVERENMEDSRSFGKMLPCVTPYEMEKQFQSAYTLKKFKEFQTELLGKMYCELSHGKEGAESLEFEVSEDVAAGDNIRRVTYLVRWNDDAQDVGCNCKLFQFRGILCRHALTVLIHEKIYCVPEKYILTRWNKTIKRSHSKIKISYAIGVIKPETVRFDKMCEAFSEVANLAANTEDRCKIVMTWVNNLKETLSTDASLSGELISSEENDAPSCGDEKMDDVPTNAVDKILSPLAVKRKGRPPSKRKQSQAELAQEKSVGQKKKTTKAKAEVAEEKNTGRKKNTTKAKQSTLQPEKTPVIGSAPSVDIEATQESTVQQSQNVAGAGFSLNAQQNIWELPVNRQPNFQQEMGNQTCYKDYQSIDISQSMMLTSRPTHTHILGTLDSSILKEYAFQRPQSFSLVGQATHTQSKGREAFHTQSDLWGKNAYRQHNMTQHPFTNVDGLEYQNMIHGTSNLQVQSAISHSNLLHEFDRRNLTHPNSYSGYFEGRR